MLLSLLTIQPCNLSSLCSSPASERLRIKASHCSGFALLCDDSTHQGRKNKASALMFKKFKSSICTAAGPHLWAEGSCLEVICERDAWQLPWLAAEEAEARKQLQEVRHCAYEMADAFMQMTAVCGCSASGGLCVASACLRTKRWPEHPAAAQSIQHLAGHMSKFGLQSVFEVPVGRQVTLQRLAREFKAPASSQ